MNFDNNLIYDYGSSGGSRSTSTVSSKVKCSHSAQTQMQSQRGVQDEIDALAAIGDGSGAFKNLNLAEKQRDISDITMKKYLQQDKENLFDLEEENSKRKNAQEEAKKKKETVQTKSKEEILVHLDVTKESKSNLGKQLRKAMGQVVRRKKPKKESTLEEVLKVEEEHTIPLNQGITFTRLTQLFGRSIYIKYFVREISPEELEQQRLLRL